MFSSPNEDVVNSELIRKRKDYDNVVILPQKNGYFRIGIPASKDKSTALSILEDAKYQYANKAWLSKENGPSLIPVDVVYELPEGYLR